MTSTALRDMLVKQEPRTHNICFVCGASRADYSIFSKSHGSHPYFPFLEHHHPPEEAENISPDGRALVCLVCYSFLTQQWDTYERTKTPQSKRIYWLKRLDNGPFAGMELSLQQDYESLFESSHISNEHEHHEKPKLTKSQQPANAEMAKQGLKYFDRPDSRDSSSCSFQSRCEKIEVEVDNPVNNALDLSMSSRSSQSSALISPCVTLDACYVCGQDAKNMLNIFAKPISNCPFFPSLLFHPKPSNAKPMDGNGKVHVCEVCHRHLLQQWDFYQRQNVPHSERSYQLRKASNVFVSHKQELSVQDNTFICFTCGMETLSSIQRVIHSYPIKEGDSYFSFLENINPHPGAHSLNEGKALVCSVCYKSLFRQLRVYELSGIPEDRRRYKFLSDSSSEEFSVLRQHLKSGITQQKYLSPTECYLCGRLSDSPVVLDTLPQNVMYFPFIRGLIKSANAKPMDHQGRVQVCAQCHCSLKNQWDAFEVAHIPSSQRQYKINQQKLEPAGNHYAINSTGRQPSPVVHLHSHDSSSEEKNEHLSKKVLTNDICYLCGKFLSSDIFCLLDTFPQKESMYFPFIRVLIKPENAKQIDQFGRVYACSHCHGMLKSQWDLFESAHVPHSQRQYKVFAPSSEKDINHDHFTNSMHIRNASSALHIQVSSPDFQVDINKHSTNLEPLLTTVSTLTVSSIITSNVHVSAGSSNSHSPRIADCKVSQTKQQCKVTPEDFSNLRILGPLDVPQSRPLLLIAATCFVCGEYSPSGHTYAIQSSPPVTSTSGNDRLKEDPPFPFFPFLSKHIPPENAEQLTDDCNALVCTFCYHSLMSQWLAYETSPHPEDSNRWHRRYNTHNYVCFICGITTYRKRVFSISVRDFPFLVEHPRPPGALALHNGECVVTCLTCFETLTTQWKDYERMKLPVEMRKYNWIVMPPPPEDEHSRGCQILNCQDAAASNTCIPGADSDHAHFDQHITSGTGESGLPHGSKPPPPHLTMQPPYGSAKPVSRTMATVSPIHQVAPHANSVFSPFGTSANSALNATRTSSFAAALRKLAKQAVDPITDKELSPITPVSSPALSQQPNTPKRHGGVPPPMYLSNHHQASMPVASPPIVTIAPTQTHISHGTEKRKGLDIGRYPHSVNNNNSNHSAEPLSLKLDASKSVSVHGDKRSDHALGAKPLSLTSSLQQIGSAVSGVPTSHQESIVSSRGFQPYRSSDEVHHPLPSHIYEPSPSSAPVGGYAYHPAFLQASHLAHPAYRLDESLYLERYGLLRPPIMPFPSSAGMLPHPSVPLYPGSRYPPELLTQSVGLVSPHSAAFNQERVKQEGERLKESDILHEREREFYQEREREKEVYRDREREHRERETEETSRTDRNHVMRSPLPLTLNRRDESPGRLGSITQGTPRDLVIRKPSPPVSSVPLNLATHPSQILHKPSHHTESDMWFTRHQGVPNGQDHDISGFKEEIEDPAGYRHPPPPLVNQGHQIQVTKPALSHLGREILENSSSLLYSKGSPYTYGKDYQKNSTDAFSNGISSVANVQMNGVFTRDKHLYHNSYEDPDVPRTNHERHSVIGAEGRVRCNSEVKNGALHSQEPWNTHSLFHNERMQMEGETNRDIPKNSQPTINNVNYMQMANETGHQLHSRVKEASLTRALLQNHITPSISETFVHANRDIKYKVISKLDLEEDKIRKARLNGSCGESEGTESDSDDESSQKIDHLLFITKGPPLELDTNPKKLKFFHIFGLTTHQRSKALELRKFLKRRRILREKSCSPSVEDTTEEQKHVQQNLSNLSELSERLCLQEDFETKAEFLKVFGMEKVTPEKKEEKEEIWKVIEQERGRRNGTVKPSQRCLELQGSHFKARGKSILSGLKRNIDKAHQRTADGNHPNGLYPSGQSASSTGGPPLKIACVELQQGRSLSAFLKPPIKSTILPVPPLVPAVSIQSSVIDQQDLKQVIVVSQDPKVQQLNKDFAQEFHDSVLQTTQMQLAEQKTYQNSQQVGIKYKRQPSTHELSENVEREQEENKHIFRWPGVEVVMESYERHILEQNVEKDFLADRCKKLKGINEEFNTQVECLGHETTELLHLRQHLDVERQGLQGAIDNLRKILQQIR